MDFGLDQIAGIAAKHGLKVMQGLWLSSSLEKSHYQIETAVALANKYPGTIRSVVVGNEVLLRGDMTATDLANTIRAIKARVHVPVTYADVWEFWLRNRDVANAVDFITIHILPYWEDFPIRAGVALPHIESIRRQVVAAFSGKEVLIGEVGWPSAGRMREGALPSPVNQTRVVQDVLALSKREKFNVNIIEAFDQPWKRALEGHSRRTLGTFRDRRDTRAEVRRRTGCVQSSALDLARCRRNYFHGHNFRCSHERQDKGHATLALACRQYERARWRHPDRLDGRECIG